jgi:peptide/nickel transport system ATP-binding protein
MLLEAVDIRTYFKVHQGWVRAVDDVSIELDRGETLGLVGESGCGKTTLGYTVAQLLPDNAYVFSGKVFFKEPPEVRMHRLEYLSRLQESPEWQGDSVQPLREFLREEYNRLKSEEKKLAQQVQAGRNRLREQLKEIRARLAALEERYNLLSITRMSDGRLREYHPEINRVRWKDISMIFQGAMNAFNPVYTVGSQIIEAILTHEDISEEEARERVKELYRLVGIPEDRIDDYPHEYSGGMGQRAMIAMALALDPALVIADEPTTALDVIMQDKILGEIARIQNKLKMAMIIITHDVSVVAETADKIAVMYAGEVVEKGTTRQVFKEAAHPYTEGLISAFPSIKGEKRRLETIPGNPPSLISPPSGCRFHPRCKYAKEICKRVNPPLINLGDGHYSKCHFAEELFGSLGG